MGLRLSHDRNAGARIDFPNPYAVEGHYVSSIDVIYRGNLGESRGLVFELDYFSLGDALLYRHLLPLERADPLLLAPSLTMAQLGLNRFGQACLNYEAPISIEIHRNQFRRGPRNPFNPRNYSKIIPVSIDDLAMARERFANNGHPDGGAAMNKAYKLFLIG